VILAAPPAKLKEGILYVCVESRGRSPSGQENPDPCFLPTAYCPLFNPNDHLGTSQMIIYGRSNDHLWSKQGDFGPAPVTHLVIIYGHLGGPPELAQSEFSIRPEP